MATVNNNRGFVITVGVRILIGFMTLSLPILILVIFLLPQVSYIVNLSQEIQKENISQTMDIAIYQSQDAVDHWVITQDPKDRVDFENVWQEVNYLRGETNKVMGILANNEILEEWTKLQQLLDPFYQAELAILNTPRKPGDIIDLHHILEKLSPMKREIMALIDGDYSAEENKRIGGVYTFLTEKISSNTSLINKNLIDLRNFAYLLLIFTASLTVFVPTITQRAIAGPIDNAIRIAERIAAGERDIDIYIKSTIKQDKLCKLLLSLKTMQEAISKNEASLRNKEEESRELFEKLVNSSKKFSEYSGKVAAGDLRERLQLDKKEILFDLGDDLNLMTDGLASITKKITKVSSDIVAMVGTVLASANEQTEGITSQASAINEISASLEEIDKSSKQTMAKAQALREIAKNTYEQGKLGTESVVQSIHGIKASEEKMRLIAQTILDLSNHTQQIGDITAVVNTLSQQSKMLALNAAIEASKAGEAGKGFAAVATEVRNLAEQSEQSTIQVQKILEDIRRTTEKAVTVTEEGAKSLDSEMKLIEKAGEVIHTLSQMINEASISSQHIEVAIRQEAVGIEQIVNSMSEINRATSTFSSGIKEMMAFIHNLDEIAKHLKDDVNIYKV